MLLLSFLSSTRAKCSEDVSSRVVEENWELLVNTCVESLLCNLGKKETPESTVELNLELCRLLRIIPLSQFVLSKISIDEKSEAFRTLTPVVVASDSNRIETVEFDVVCVALL